MKKLNYANMSTIGDEISKIFNVKIVIDFSNNILKIKGKFNNGAICTVEHPIDTELSLEYDIAIIATKMLTRYLKYVYHI